MSYSWQFVVEVQYAFLCLCSYYQTNWPSLRKINRHRVEKFRCNNERSIKINILEFIKNNCYNNRPRTWSCIVISMICSKLVMIILLAASFGFEDNTCSIFSTTSSPCRCWSMSFMCEIIRETSDKEDLINIYVNTFYKTQNFKTKLLFLIGICFQQAKQN